MGVKKRCTGKLAIKEFALIAKGCDCLTYLGGTVPMVMFPWMGSTLYVNVWTMFGWLRLLLMAVSGRIQFQVEAEEGQRSVPSQACKLIRFENKRMNQFQVRQGGREVSQIWAKRLAGKSDLKRKGWELLESSDICMELVWALFRTVHRMLANKDK